MPSRRLSPRLTLGVVALAALAVGLVHHSVTRREAPALPPHALSGRPVTIAQLRGHPAALVFWASWCTDCRVEADAVERFARSPAGRGRVVGIDYDDGGPWHAFLTAHHWTFPVLQDSSGTTGAAFGVGNLPATVILDSSGRIASVRYGAQTAATLAAALSRAG